MFTAPDGWGYFFLTSSPILDLGHFSQVILPIVLQIMPPPQKLAQPSGAVNSTWWLGLIFFFDLFSQSGLRAFFTSDFANCTTNYAPTIRCCSQHLMVGVFFLPVLPFWTEGIFHRWFCQLYYSLCQTIRCCSQHLMVGVIFFLTCSPVLDLGHFAQMILPIVLQIMQQPKNNPNHQVLWTASDGWG